MELRREGSVFIVDLGSGENRVDPGFVSDLDGVITEVAAASGPRALVTTGTGKFYSNGFDLDLVGEMDGEALAAFAGGFEEVLGRLLTAPFVTVAAIQGHCFAAGALLALCHDYRVMRQDRGWFCLPSVDVGIPFTRAMTELITAKIPPPTAHHLVISADRMGGSAAEGYGVVNDAVDGAQVMSRALAFAERLAGKDPETLGTIKHRMYATVTDHIG
jgi:enoyl-CoA hydratase/carnithine racemase